jgi:hypothetical protein
MRRAAWCGMAVAAVLLGAPNVWADEVTDQIDEGLKAYKAKDYGGAAMALDTATSLIRQQAAEGMTRVLPAPLAGWEADEAESGAGGAAMGGTTASRRYTRTFKVMSTPEPGQEPEEYENTEAVDITIMGNSPALQAMMMMFSNPMFAGPNAKVMMIGGRKTMFNKGDNSLMTIVNNQVMVTVDGDDTVKMDDLKAYYAGIDFKALEKQTQ